MQASPLPASTISTEQIQKLIKRAQDGDESAVGELLDAYRGYLRTVARRRMSDGLARRLDPSDLVQQTMLEAYQGFQQILSDDQSHLRATLRRILTCNVSNAIRDHFCTDKRQMGRERADSQLLRQQSDDLTSPSGCMMKAESLQRFLLLIDQLPDDQATAIRMRYFEYASVGEIGTTLGRSRVAAAGLLKRGLAELRKLCPEDDV